MARKAGEKHREETEEAKQSQDGTPGQSVQDADTGVVTTQVCYSSTSRTWTLPSIRGTDHNL